MGRTPADAPEAEIPQRDSYGSYSPHDEDLIVRDSREDMDTLLLQALSDHNADRFDLAIETYTRILEAKPRGFVQTLVYVHRGIARFMTGDYGLAFKDFSAALKRDADNSRALYCRGIVHYVLKNYSESLTDLSRSLDIDPCHFDSLLGRAQVHHRLGNYLQALSDCEQALALEQSSKRAQNLLEMIRRDLCT